MKQKPPICDQCRQPFKPTRPGQRFCVGKNCRQKWHREHALPGKVTGIRALKTGAWSVTIHTGDVEGLKIGSRVRLENDI